QRHHAHHRQTWVLGQLADAFYLAARARRVADTRGNEEAARMRVTDLEHLLGAAVETGREDAGRDAELVHQFDQRGDADRSAIASEIPGDVLVSLGRHELLGGLLGDEIYP